MIIFCYDVWSSIHMYQNFNSQDMYQSLLDKFITAGLVVHVYTTLFFSKKRLYYCFFEFIIAVLVVHVYTTFFLKKTSILLFFLTYHRRSCGTCLYYFFFTKNVYTTVFLNLSSPVFWYMTILLCGL